jgi:pimeloyl-ACP methyl ester carboxylesterase
MLLASLFVAAATIASADGVPIRYETTGQGNPAIVFVHGWACDRHYWDAQVPRFARKHQVVTLDLAGHGESGRDRKQWSIPAFAGDVRAVADALHLEQVVLVGHSMGGPVIVDAARQMPGRVVALVPVDIFMNVSTSLSAEQRAQFAGALRSDFKGTTADFVTRMFTPRSKPALVQRIVQAMSSAPSEIAVAAMEGIWSYDIPAALGETKIPIRCINSDRRPTDVEAARRFAPQFQVVIMKGLGHFVMIEQPKAFDRLLENAIRELVPRR